MDRLEKRTHKRQEARYDVSCQRIGSPVGKSYSGCTHNVSSGGLYVETVAGEFKQGDLLKVELTVPPTPGVLEFGGKIASYARVLRADNLGADPECKEPGCAKEGVALRFCRAPKLSL